jgi:putative ABC transport system permease protein
VLDLKIRDQQNQMAWTSGALASKLPDLSAVSETVRLFRYRSPSVVLEKGKPDNFSEDNFIWADRNVFDVFKFPFVKGDAATALTRPNTIVISESVSKKYFGDEDPIGKVLSNVTFNADFEVTGVMRDMPETSHFKADLICSLLTLPRLWGDQILSNWGNSFLYTYIKTAPGSDRVQLETEINRLVAKDLPPSKEVSYNYSLQRLTDIHLHSKLQNEWQSNSDIAYIHILTFVGILVLIVSVINYINLWIARSEQRVHEIGVRQAIGGNKKELVFQFLTENFVHGLIALAAGVALSGLLVPFENEMLGEDLNLSPNIKQTVWGLTATVVFVLMTFASLYRRKLSFISNPPPRSKGTIVRLRKVWASGMA